MATVDPTSFRSTVSLLSLQDINCLMSAEWVDEPEVHVKFEHGGNELSMTEH